MGSNLAAKEEERETNRVRHTAWLSLKSWLSHMAQQTIRLRTLSHASIYPLSPARLASCAVQRCTGPHAACVFPSPIPSHHFARQLMLVTITSTMHADARLHSDVRGITIG